MKINTQMTIVMMRAKVNEKALSIQIESQRIQQVKQFIYLGVIIERNGNQDIDLMERIAKTVKTYHVMKQAFINKKEIAIKTNITVFKTIYRPLLTYRCETQVVTNNIKSKVQAIEIKYLRGAKGITRRDKIGNTAVRKELQIESLLDFIYTT